MRRMMGALVAWPYSLFSRLPYKSASVAACLRHPHYSPRQNRSNAPQSYRQLEEPPLRGPEPELANPPGATAPERPEGSAENVDDQRPPGGDETVGDLNLAPTAEEAEHQREEDSEAYVVYKPSIEGPQHPGVIVETKAMSTVPLPAARHKKARVEEIAVTVTPTSSDIELLEVAIERNAKHGTQPSQVDKRHI